MNMTKVFKIKCPACKSAFNYYSSEFRPFCSQRCKNIDLGHWFSESYKVPGEKVMGEQDLNEFEVDEVFFVDEDESKID